MKSSLKGLVQIAVVRTSFFPLSYLYRKAYGLSVALAAFLLGRIDGVETVYLRRGAAGGEMVYGLSDIDLAVIVKDRDGGDEAVRARVSSVYDSLSHFIPLFGNPREEFELYSVSEFSAFYEDYDFCKYRFHEGKRAWRLLYGRDLLRELPNLEDSQLCLPAIEEVKRWWAFLTSELAAEPNRSLVNRRYLWYKAISEAARGYLFVCHGQWVMGREGALAGVREHLAPEQRRTVDRVRSFIRRLLSREDLGADELIGLFMSLAGRATDEAERRTFGESEARTVTLMVPRWSDLMVSEGIEALLRRAEEMIRAEMGASLASAAVIPQVEFSLDALSNSDVDSFYLVLNPGEHIEIEKLGRLRALLRGNMAVQAMEPFALVDGSFAFSLWGDNPARSVKSRGLCPLFFAMLPESAPGAACVSRGGDGGAIRSAVPRRAFEERIGKRAARIDGIISGKDVYKIRTIEFLRFFWAAARTKLLARSFESPELQVPVTSRQILEALTQSFPDDAGWLRALHREYARELLGENNESYRYFSRSVDLLNRA